MSKIKLMYWNEFRLKVSSLYYYELRNSKTECGRREYCLPRVRECRHAQCTRGKAQIMQAIKHFGLYGVDQLSP